MDNKEKEDRNRGKMNFMKIDWLGMEKPWRIMDKDEEGERKERMEEMEGME